LKIKNRSNYSYYNFVESKNDLLDNLAINEKFHLLRWGGSRRIDSTISKITFEYGASTSFDCSAILISLLTPLIISLSLASLFLLALAIFCT